MMVIRCRSISSIIARQFASRKSAKPISHIQKKKSSKGGGLKFLSNMGINLSAVPDINYGANEAVGLMEANRTLSQPTVRDHYPVMIEEVRALVSEYIKSNPEKENVFLLDCSIGTGGHSLKLLEDHEHLVV